MRAIISIYDKRGIVDFARRLAEAGVELISTGGTYKVLAEDGGLPVQQVSDVTGSPEILDGRVKTLHPRIHGGLLARRDDPDHMTELENQSIQPIDLVVSNLYPFVDTVSKPGVGLDEALENIDIGGPSMIRAGAKNFPSVAVVVDPADYSWVADRIAGEGLSLEERQGLAFKAFQHVSTYDTAVAAYLGTRTDSKDGAGEGRCPRCWSCPTGSTWTCATEKTLTRRPPCTCQARAAEVGQGKAGTWPGAVIQQPAGCRRSLADRHRFRWRGRGHHQAHQPVRPGCLG